MACEPNCLLCEAGYNKYSKTITEEEKEYSTLLKTLLCPECLVKSLYPYKPNPDTTVKCLTCAGVFSKDFVFKYNESKTKEKKVIEAKCPKCAGLLNTYYPAMDVYTCDSCQMQFAGEYLHKFSKYKNSLHNSGMAQDVFKEEPKTIIRKVKKPDPFKDSFFNLINNIKRLADYRTKDDSEVTDEQLDKLFESIFIQTDEIIAVHYQGVEFNSEKTEDLEYSNTTYVHPFDPDYSDSPFPNKSLNDEAAEKFNQKSNIFDNAVDKKALEELLKFADQSLLQKADKLPADENGMVVFQIKQSYKDYIDNYNTYKYNETFEDHIKTCLSCAQLVGKYPNVLKIGNF